MTPQEFAPIAALIDNTCKDDFDEGREAAYAIVLAHLPAVDVRQAVINLLGRPGGAWLPSTREIAAEVHAVQYVGTPEWARERLGAMFYNLPDAAAAETSLAAYEGRPMPLDGAFAEQVLAIHDVYGKQLLATLRALDGTYGIHALIHAPDLWRANAPAWRAWTDTGFQLVAPAPTRQLGERAAR